MPNPNNPQENPQSSAPEELPGTDFYESEPHEAEERERGQKIGSTFEELDHLQHDQVCGKQVD